MLLCSGLLEGGDHLVQVVAPEGVAGGQPMPEAHGMPQAPALHPADQVFGNHIMAYLSYHAMACLLHHAVTQHVQAYSFSFTTHRY